MKPLLLAAGVLVLAGCGDSAAPPTKDGVLQTRFVGDLSSGGHTSGEVMATAGKPSTTQPGPAGTPGIPKGAEGNTGGTAMGGTTAATTPGQQPAGPAPAAAAPGQAASAALTPASAASAPALSDAQRQQQELTASMDAVAARWHARAAAQGRDSSNAATGAAASAQPSVTGAHAADMTIRSEKFGTAPASTDVKTATKPATPAVLDPKSPVQAGPKP